MSFAGGVNFLDVFEKRIVRFIVREVGCFVMRFIPNIAVRVGSIFFFRFGVLVFGFRLGKIRSAHGMRNFIAHFIGGLFMLGLDQTFGQRAGLLFGQIGGRAMG